MSNCKEIIGLRNIGLYINNNVQYEYPDPSNENEVNFISHAEGSFIIEEKENPVWTREIGYSENYEPYYIDTFSFYLRGILNEAPDQLKRMRKNRRGYIVDIITKSGDSFVFPTEVFLSSETITGENENFRRVNFSYRVPTLTDKLTKLSNILMTNSYIKLNSNEIVGLNKNVIAISK